MPLQLVSCLHEDKLTKRKVECGMECALNVPSWYFLGTTAFFVFIFIFWSSSEIVEFCLHQQLCVCMVFPFFKTSDWPSGGHSCIFTASLV